MGLNLLLDTNAIIALLNNDKNILALASNSDEIYVSIISEIEFRSFANLSDNDHGLLTSFLARVTVIGLDHEDEELIQLVTSLRKRYKLKLPDTIIAASALKHNATLITADVAFQKIKEILVKSW